MKPTEFFKELNEQHRKLNQIKKAIQTLPADYNSYWLSYGIICMRIGHSIEAMRQFRQALGSEWRRSDARYTSPKMQDGAYCFHYRNADGIELFVYTEILDGQSCQRVKVGEKIEPIYEIRCSTVSAQ